MYAFAKLRRADLPLIEQWLHRPHVRDWWPGPDVQLGEIEDHLNGTDVNPYLIMLAARPIGYLQCHDPAAAEPKIWPAQPVGTRGLDLFIGEDSLLGQGHGTAIIRAFVDGLFARGAPRVVTDPDPANRRAVRCYEKAGFRSVGPLVAPWGTTIIMAHDAPHLTRSETKPS